MKGFSRVMVPALTSLGYLLIVVVSIFPFWVRLVNKESHEVFFSGPFENCFHVKCWKPRPLSTKFFPRTWKQNFVLAFISFFTAVCALLALVLHALEIRALRMKLGHLQFSVLWPYYVLGFDVFLFIVAGTICLAQEIACPCCHLLSVSQRMEEGHGCLHLDNLESLGGELSSVQKETLVTEETVI
ncbi:transmembrane protein 225B isoform X2 [Callithrix jacchus]|uniref:transmembrane protein 225B isoform X2 n=1 Tax=Callithrix jacchus TaxID=9483 RepID=UPI0004F0387C|nr:transmembrane protein 225B isoform X2 [Callithrix jacchus]XP_035138063.1 transmembrane protein 225B isoform X2 [Callithrix jacchus]